MNTAEKLLLRRRRELLIPERDGARYLEFVASLMRNLESIGFTFSPAVIERLQYWTPEELLVLAEDLLPLLLKEVGGSVRYEPMYPNFPAQVMETSEMELYINAILHYYGDAIGERILPQYEKQVRPSLQIPEDLMVIDLAAEDALVTLTRSLTQSNTSLSASDSADLKALLHEFRDDLEAVLPEEIPFREVRAMVCESLLRLTEEPAAFLARYLNTATDALRFVTELSGGDTSLARKTKYRSFSRRERRCILGLLERCENRQEDMNRHRGKWLRVGERIHPGEYEARFPQTYRAFAALRNGDPVRTFNSRVEGHLRANEVGQAAALLKSRPGDLARRLDHLLRSHDDHETILASFESVAEKVSTPVLLQMFAHFRERGRDQEPKQIVDVPEEQKLGFFEKVLRALKRPPSTPAVLSKMRTVFPKGDAAKLMRVPNVLLLIPPQITARVMTIVSAALRDRFAKLPPLGKVYLAPEMKNFTVPFSQRSASKSLRTLSRGSRLPLPDGSTIRFFLWWKEGKVDGNSTGRVDIDLSATFYRADWSYLSHVSYTQLKNAKIGSYHSGDITSAPNGACEFIDVDLERARSAGARYLITSVQAYTGHPFCNLPECFTGWMARSEPQSGEAFEPATVQDKVDLAANSQIAIPTVIDLETREVYWADLALRSLPGHQINVEANERGLVHYGVAITTMVKPTLFDLFELHLQARGESVETADEAETVFSPTQGVTPFDVATVASDYLA